MKKFLHVILTVVMLCTAASCSSASYYNEGNDGLSEAGAYVIDSISDLIELRDRVNSGIETYGAYYRMEFPNKTVNFTEYTSWEPIGYPVGYERTFTGHFDGNDHTIYMNITDNYQNKIPVSALFGNVATKGGYAIKDLNISAVGNYMIDGENASGIADNLQADSTIENCTFSGNVRALHSYYEGNGSKPANVISAGGIVRVITAGTIKNCKIRRGAKISAFIRNKNSSRYVPSGICRAGGIAGAMGGGTIENCIVEAEQIVGASLRGNSTTVKDTEVTDGYTGGIVGYGSSTFGTVKNCTVSSWIIGTYYAGGIAGYFSGGVLEDNQVLSSSTIQGNSTVGGICGYIEGAALRSNIVNAVEIFTENNIAGGIAGVLTSGGIIENCEIKAGADTKSNGTEAGGIVGVLGGGTLRNNKSYSAISGTASHKGGVIGKIDNASPTVENNYYSGADYGIGYDASGMAGDNPGCVKIVSVTITKETLLSGRVNSYYSDTLTADISDIIWSVSGNFPSELDFDESTGEIYGTPKTANTYNFTARATHTSGSYAEKSFTLTINAAPSSEAAPSITTTKLKAGKVGKKYTPKVKASGKNITWSASDLPAGVTLNPSTGKFSGLPENSGTYNVRVTATNSGGADTKTFSVVINDIKPNIKGKAKAGKVGVDYLAEFYTTKGTGNIVWTLTPDSLPEGLEYDYDTEGATIEGTPEETWKQKYTLTATNSAGSKTKKFTLKIKK